MLACRSTDRRERFILRGKTGFASVIVVALLICLGFALPGAGAAEPEFDWLCKPGKADDPCAVSLTTKRVLSNGSSSVHKPKPMPALKRKVDCFYVYPTVSGQRGPNANLDRDPELEGIARQQAAGFAPGCRVFAPIYRQFTIPAMLSGESSPGVLGIGYASVRAAWDEYLERHNAGRGVVLIGHSQGTAHLKRLVAETFDRDPRLRKRLVSALLIGGDVVVAKGKRVGGDFDHVPTCVKPGETGCVIGYSEFLEEAPPADTFFGRVGGPRIDPRFSAATHEVICVNPAELDGSDGNLKPVYETAPFPGIYGPLLPKLSGVGAPYASYPGLYTASCERTDDGVSWLRAHDISTEADARPRVGEPMGRAWGMHLTEVNDAFGNLTGAVARQETTYVKRINQARKKAQKKRRKAARAKAKARAKARKAKLKKAKAKAKKAKAKKKGRAVFGS